MDIPNVPSESRNGFYSPYETFQDILAAGEAFPTFSDASSSAEEDEMVSDGEMEAYSAADVDMDRPIPPKQADGGTEAVETAIMPLLPSFLLGDGFAASFLNTLEELMKLTREAKTLRWTIVNSMEADASSQDTKDSTTTSTSEKDGKKSSTGAFASPSDKWYNMPKQFQGTSAGQRFHELQSRLLPLLLLQIRLLNRNLCQCLEEVDEAVLTQKQALRNTRDKQTDIQYELAWFKRRIHEEDSFSTPVWEELRKVMIPEEEYIQDGQHELTFVRKEEDLHQFTLNWLNYDLQERIKGKESLDAIKRDREMAEQRLQALYLKEAEIPKKLLAIEKAVEDVYNICASGTAECVEFPDEARTLPGPLLNLFSRLFMYRHLMSDTKSEVHVETDSEKVPFTVKDPIDALYEPHHEEVILLLHLEEDAALPDGLLVELMLSFPVQIIFQYLPSLDLVVVSTNITDKLGPQKNIAILSSLLERDADDLGLFSPNPSNYHNELPDGLFENQRCKGGRPFRWAQTLAAMKYGITLPYVKALPEEVNVGELLKRIRNRVAFRIWAIFQTEHLRSKPNEVVSVRQTGVLPALPNSVATVRHCVKSSIREYREAATLQSWPEDIEAEDMLYTKMVVQLSNRTLMVYVAVPLNELCARFRFVQTTASDAAFCAEKELSEYELQIYNAQSNTEPMQPLRASNTIVKNDVLTHYQHAALQDLEDFVNNRVVEQYGGMEGSYRFTMFSIQMASMKIGIDKYIKDDNIEMEGHHPLAEVNDIPQENDISSSLEIIEIEDVEMS